MSTRPPRERARERPAAGRNLALVGLSWPGPGMIMQNDDRDPESEPALGSANNKAKPPDEPPSDAGQADWVGAAGVSGEHVMAGERAPRLHWALMILGPIGLAIAIVLSLWSSGRRVERSVNVQVETTWEAGEQLAVRAQILDGELEALAGTTVVTIRVEDADGRGEALGTLAEVGPGLAQGSFIVPALAVGEAEFVVHFEPASEQIEPFEERLPITIVDERATGAGHQVIAAHMLQWADDTDEQPPGVRIDLRPAGRLLAGFDNTMFVRVTDPAGKPWVGEIRVLLISGEFGRAIGREIGREIGRSDESPVLFEGPVDLLGLASISGQLTSDVVRFEVRLRDPAQPSDPKPPEARTLEAQPPDQFNGPKRRLRFVSHAGTVSVHASTNFAHPGDTVELTVDAISARKPVFVDVHRSDGAWLDTFTPPLRLPQDREWTIPTSIAETSKVGALIQFEAYQSTLRPEDSSAIARVQVTPAGTSKAASVAALIERQRQQLSLPRIDEEFEIDRERAYLSEIEALLDTADQATVDRARAFLLGSLQPVVHGPTQALNTRAREDQTLAAFKRRATRGVRWFLLGGGALFILVMSAMVWRNQRKLELQTSGALGLVAEDSDSSIALDQIDPEVLADQSLAIVRARRELMIRGALTIGLMIAALLLTVAMLENLVWNYG